MDKVQNDCEAMDMISQDAISLAVDREKLRKSIMELLLHALASSRH